jgi:hypothetical protein
VPAVAEVVPHNEATTADDAPAEVTEAAAVEESSQGTVKPEASSEAKSE